MLELIHHAILAVIEKKSTGIFREINYYNQFLKLQLMACQDKPLAISKEKVLFQQTF